MRYSRTICAGHQIIHEGCPEMFRRDPNPVATETRERELRLKAETGTNITETNHETTETQQKRK